MFRLFEWDDKGDFKVIGIIAWRNILRNKRRSLILIASIVVGVVALVLTEGFAVGMLHQMLTNQIGADAGYIQIHRNGYQSDPTLDNSMSDPQAIRKILRKESGTLNYAERLRVFGLVSSAYNSYGVSIVGIIPKEEKKISTISKYVLKGAYLSGEPGQILISASIAEKLRVGLGDKIVIMASREDGSIGSEACRITGIYETYNSGFDQSHVYIPMQTAVQMLDAKGLVSEFVVNPLDPQKTDLVAETIRHEVVELRGPNHYEVLTYEQMLPLLVSQLALYKEALYLISVIIAIALVFGIVDSMMMAVMERTHEFGVSMAIGMASNKIFTMVMTEAFFVAVIGTAIGVAASYGIMIPLSHTGWNLSMFSDSMRSVGVGSVIYPAFNASVLMQSVVIIPIVTLLGAIYPALKAIKLQPVDAIRAV